MGLKAGNPLAYMGIKKAIPEVETSTSSPTTTNSNFDPGDIWVNTTLKRVFLMASNVGGIGTWIDGGGESSAIDSDFISGILEVCAVGAAVTTEGNRYIASATGGGWTQHYIYTYENASWTEIIPSEGVMGYNHDTNGFIYWTGAAWDALPSGVTTLAALTDTTIAGAAGGDMLFHDGVNSWDNKVVSGDCTAASTGAITVVESTDMIMKTSVVYDQTTADYTLSWADPAVARAISWDDPGGDDKFVFADADQVLKTKTLDDATTKFGDTADPTKDLFFSLGGATAGKTMTIISSHDADRSLTLPNATDTLTGKATADTLTNKVLSDSTCTWGDNADVTKAATWSLGGATAGKTMTIVSSHDADRSLTLPNATDTLTGKATTDTLTNKVLSDSTCTWGDNADVTKAATWSLGGATSGKTMTIVSSHTDDRSLTLPDATDTITGKATTDIFTNKSYDSNGAGNVLTNVNGAELEDAAATTALGMAVPFIIKKDISNALTTSLYAANFPQKARLIKAWVEETANNTGNVTIDDGANVICAAVAYAGADTDITDFPNIDDARSTLAANASLRCLNSVNTDDAMVYMMFIPIA